ncbi:MAG: hypothetical protein K0R54_763 [Clostridiaceae bacterium]|jgi:hypothetical protein|nr:hypothetical protein [Clostridiaceae bacterium]
MKNNINTAWTKATEDYTEAMVGLLSAIDAGKNAWIEIRKNGDQDIPIMISNPELDHPKNWTMFYGCRRNLKELENRSYINDMEKELTYNYTTCFGPEKAVDNYYATGQLTKDNFFGIGMCHAVKISDCIEYRKNTDGYNNYEYWVTFWKPKDGIAYRVPKEIDKVFTICYDDEPLDRKYALSRAKDFIEALIEQV